MMGGTTLGRMVVLVLAVVGCRDAPSAAPPAGPCGPGTRAAIVDVPVNGFAVVGADSASCVRLEPASGRFLVATQFAGTSNPSALQSFSFGSIAPAAAALMPPMEGAQVRTAPLDAALALERSLRAAERTPAERQSVAVRAFPTVRTTPVLGASESFTVLSTITAPATYRGVSARARFVGSRIALFVDTTSVGALTEGEWQALGTLMDASLAPAAEAAFGTPSDIDGNGRVLVLFSPVVNSMVSTLECGRTGSFVRGFFNPEDLRPGGTGNDGEVFYALVPDPTGRFSCSHTPDEVKRWSPPVFIHEYQHMLSYAEHVLRRSGPPEEPWLNEGLSHLAEEIGGRIFEARYPAPQQRTRPGQLLPDSAEAYVLPNVGNAYDWLDQPMYSSPLAYDTGSYGSMVERGASWLFLRWLLNHGGPASARALVQTRLTGLANLEAVSGRPVSALLGDFALAIFADSMPGRPRALAPERLRFGTRPIRAVFADYLAAFPQRGNGFPVLPTLLQGRRGYAMRGLTMQYFVAEPSTSAQGRVLHFSAGDLSPLASARRPQLSILRLPN
jgi:hypothetical protein